MKYTFTFKEITTQQTIHMFANSNSTIDEFVKNAKKIIYFNLEGICLNKTLEIIEAGQYNNRNGFAPELADKLESCYDENATLEQIFGVRWKNTSFYIRLCEENQSPLESESFVEAINEPVRSLRGYFDRL